MKYSMRYTLFLFLLIAAPVYAVRTILAWQDNSDNETGFTVYRSINDSAFEVVATTPARS